MCSMYDVSIYLYCVIVLIHIQKASGDIKDDNPIVKPTPQIREDIPGTNEDNNGGNTGNLSNHIQDEYKIVKQSETSDNDDDKTKENPEMYKIVNEETLHHLYPHSRSNTKNTHKRANLAWHTQWKSKHSEISKVYTLKTGNDFGTVCVNKVIQVKNLNMYKWEIYLDTINEDKYPINIGFIQIGYGFIGWYPKQMKWDQLMSVKGVSCYVKIVNDSKFITIKIGKEMKNIVNTNVNNELLYLPNNGRIKNGDRIGFIIKCKERQCLLQYNGINMGIIFENLPDYIVPAIDYQKQQNVLLARSD